MDPIECLHELEDLGLEHAINLVKSECCFLLLVVLEAILGYGRSGGIGLRGAIETWCCCLPPTRLPRS